MLLTVIKENCKPIESEFILSDSGALVTVNHSGINIIDVEDELTSGNGDGILNPGELAILQIPLSNIGQNTVNDVQASLFSESSNINVINNVNQYGSLNSGEDSYGVFYFLIDLNEELIFTDNTTLRLDIADSQNNLWQSLIYLDIHKL